MRIWGKNVLDFFWDHCQVQARVVSWVCGSTWSSGWGNQLPKQVSFWCDQCEILEPSRVKKIAWRFLLDHSIELAVEWKRMMLVKGFELDLSIGWHGADLGIINGLHSTYATGQLDPLGHSISRWFVLANNWFWWFFTRVYKFLFVRKFGGSTYKREVSISQTNFCMGRTLRNDRHGLPRWDFWKTTIFCDLNQK